MKLRDPVRVLNSRYCYAPSATIKRAGVMIHYDDSANDVSAVAWFTDPACDVSYNRLYLDDGTTVQITPTVEHAAWHAGVCLTPHANHAFYGLAAATDGVTPVTSKQYETLLHDVVALFVSNGWHAADVATRIVGHDEQATWDKTNAPNDRRKWGKLGRKVDPTGIRKDRAPIISLQRLRTEVAALLSEA